MFKKVFTVLILSVFALGFYYSDIVFAQTTDSVTATVTLQNVSLSVSDGQIAYGTIAASSNKSTVDLTDTQTITNDGNVPITINISGSNSANWTLGATAAADTFVHSFCTSGCSSYPTGYTALTVDYDQLATGVAASATRSLDLNITAPTSSSVFTQQSVNVTVQAVAE